MQCKKCGYELQPFETACPRCTKKGIGQDQFDLRRQSTKDQMLSEMQRYEKAHPKSDITPLRAALFSLLGIGCLVVTISFGNFLWGNSIDSRINSAVKNGSLTMTKSLVATAPKLVNAHGYLGRTPLHWTAIKGQPAIAEYLLDSGADINAKDAGGGTPLHAAALNGQMKMAALLVGRKAVVAAADKLGRTALFSAAEGGQFDMIGYLLSLHAPPPKNKPDQPGIQYLPVNSKDAAGLTPLHVAVMHRKLISIDCLLKNSADVNAKDNAGATPLRTANELKRDDEIIEALIAAGGDG
ncbi:MAG: ankyrin repeat domain-containing protein [Armatimonadota bacterium]